MSYADERAAIETRWFTQWVDNGSPRTPTRVESLPGFVPPTDKSWAALYILGGESQQASVGAPGSNFWRTASSIVVQLYTPMVDTSGIVAARRLDALADHAIPIFRGIVLDNLRFGAPWRGPSQSDDPWLMCTITTPIWRDDIG